MALKGGPWSLNMSLEDLGNNADKDGIIILIHVSLKSIGPIIKNGFFFWHTALMATNGQKWQKCFQDVQTTPLKIIGTQQWKKSSNKCTTWWQVKKFFKLDLIEKKKLFYLNKNDVP